jgi:hypothetical protein
VTAKLNVKKRVKKCVYLHFSLDNWTAKLNVQYKLYVTTLCSKQFKIFVHVEKITEENR